MIIQPPEWEGWRISGGDTDWRIEYAHKRKGEDEWRPMYFYSCLEYAVEKAYELTLRESQTAANDLKAALAECRRVKKALADEVRKAVA